MSEETHSGIHIRWTHCHLLIPCGTKLYQVFDVFIKYLEQFLLLKRLSFFHVSSLSCSVS